MTENQVHPDSDHTKPTADVIKPPQNDEKPLLAPQGTYVIQIPKDQIYRIPPPENSQKIKKLANRKPKRSFCCRCLCFTLSVILIVLLLLAITTTVLYLIYKPEKLNYSIDSISIPINLTSSSPLNPRVTLNIKFQNPNDKIEVEYVKGSKVNVYYDDVDLCNGELTAFDQKANNMTLVRSVCKGGDVVLARDIHARLVKEEKGGRVVVKVAVRAPMKVKVGGVKTWEITVNVKCDVAVDQLTKKSKIVDRSCGYRVKLW